MTIGSETTEQGDLAVVDIKDLHHAGPAGGRGEPGQPGGLVAVEVGAVAGAAFDQRLGRAHARTS